MVWNIVKAAANLDPLGVVEETAKTATTVATTTVKTGASVVTDPLGTVNDVHQLAIQTAGESVNFAAHYVPGVHISVGGMDLEICIG